ncbi:MAG: hypothetical protein GX992_00640 [Clostridium sp.]|nr:hypothetical protein [Clostridium sp.]
MSANLICTRCNGTMVQGRTKGTFSGTRPDGMAGFTQTIKYMCRDCGRIEERAINAKHLFKSLDYVYNEK